MKPALVFSACTFLMLSPLSLPAQENDTPKSSPQALNVYSDAANFQNNGEFALAAEEWQNFIKRFPKDPLANKAEHYAGVCYQQLKAYDKAATHFAAVLKANPKFELAEDASLNLGWCRYKLGSEEKPELFDQAAQAFAVLVKQFPKGKYTDQALFYLGESLYARQKKPQAIAAYKKLVDDHPKSSLRSDGLYALGVTHEEVQEYVEAGAVYDLFLKEFADSALSTEVRMRKAETILQAGDLAAAEKMFGEVAAVENFASADHAIYRQAFCVAKQDKFAEAGKLYAKLAADFAESSYVKEAMLSAGRSFYRASEFEEAAKWLQQVIEKDEANAPEAAHWLNRIHIRNGEPDKAVALAAAILPKAEGSAYLVHLKMDQADALYEVPERREEALGKYLQIASDHADDESAPQALYNAAFTAMELQKHDDGLKHAAAFISKYPDDRFLPDTKYVAADCNLKLGKHAEAETGYRELLDKFQEHAEYDTWRVRLGLALYSQKKYQDSIEALQTTIGELKAADQIAEGQFLLGASRFHLDQFEVAAKSLAESLKAAPKWRQADETTLYLSRAQRGLKQFDAAKVTVAKLIRDFPESALLDQALFRSGEYNYASGDFAAAAKAYDVVVSKWADSIYVPYSLYGKGWALLKAKQFPGGMESFTALIDKFADHELASDAHLGRAMCRRQAGEHENAISDIAIFLKSSPETNEKSDALYERGLSEVALKKFEQATASFEALLAENKEYGNTANVLYELGWAYKHREQEENATTTFTKLAAGHPESLLAPEANLHVAEANYDNKSFDEAAKFYLAAKEKAKPGEVAERATHKLGWSYFRLGKHEEALAQFEEQIKSYADGKLLADGLFMKGESLFKLARHQAAFTAFTAATRKPSADKQKQVLTLLHGGQSAGQAGKWQDSLKLLDQVAKKFEDSPYLAEATYERGWAKQNLKQLDEAVEDYEKAAELSRGAVGARAQFMIGEVLFEQKKFNGAIRRFKRVMFGYGGENAPEKVKQWQALAGYEAGRCAEVQIKNESDAARRAKLIADSKSSFMYVVQRHPQHEKVAPAKERLAALAKL
jgi:TolA-binding protein